MSNARHQPVIPAEKARQGEIILKRPWQRGLFIAGLVAAFVAVVAIPFLVK